jgi:exopolyphosphatase/guanosine-5'-triphosphate,3'-diphosphate pyrophosphatase
MCLARRGEELPESLNQLCVSRRELVALERQLFATDASGRAKLPGADQRRAELLPAGIVVLNHLMAATQLEELTISDWALREGIVLSAIGSHDRAELDEDPRALRRASLLALCRRCNWRQRHAHRVAQLALELFDALGAVSELAGEDREILELAALSHDIGEHVSRADHDRHSAYLIEHGGLRGFKPEEVRELAALVRYHLRGRPRGAGGDAGRRRLLLLIALLRIADALDASHSDVVDGLHLVGVDDSSVTLGAIVRGDAELEQWAFRRKRELAEKLLGRHVELSVERHGREEYEAAELAPGYS